MIALAREADRDWMTDAACRDHDPEMFFPTPRQKLRSTATTRALAICNGCPVKKRCVDYADSHGERYGVWGGQYRHKRARKKEDSRG